MLMMLRLFVISFRDYTLTMFFVRVGFFSWCALIGAAASFNSLEKNLIFLKKNLNFASFAIFMCYKKARIFS